MARVSSRKRSLIEWSWSSIPFNAASTADKSVTLVAGYTAICKQQHQHQHPWMKTWTKKRRERERERETVAGNDEVLKLGNASVERRHQRLQRRACCCFLRLHISLSLSLKLNYTVWFLRLWSLPCDCDLLLFWNPGKWFWREHWLCFPQFVFQTTPSQVCSLATYDGLNYKFVFFFIFFKELQILYLKKKNFEEKHYFGS